MATNGRKLDAGSLGSWLWEAACTIRGPLDAPKFKDYILPLIFLKRLSDVFEDEVKHYAQEFGDADTALAIIDQDRRLVRFFMPEETRWPRIARLPEPGLGEALTDAVKAVATHNPRLQSVIDVQDFNATAAGQRIVDDGRLHRLVQVLSQYRLGLDDVEPDVLGRAYEYLLRKFAEGQGQSAGEFYTPREVTVLIARLVEPEPGMEVYDPCVGSAGLLIKCHLRLLDTHGERQNGRLRLPDAVAPLRFYGQEINVSPYAISRMNAVIHGMETVEIALNDTMRRPAFNESDGSLRQFHVVVSNPMWNQDIATTVYETDPYGRFSFGTPPASSADWGWVQHMLASLKDEGRMAVVLDTGAVSRGSGNQGSNRERDIRKAVVERDLVEAVVLLPENLFYNTTAPGIIMVLNQRKAHPGEILIINASKLFSKGRPKNFLDEEHVDQVARLYQEWRAEEGLSAVITKKEAARNDYNLSPSRYVAQNGGEEVLPLEEAMVLLREAEEERAEADAELDRVLRSLGLGGWRHG